MVPIERLDEMVRLIGESASAHLRVGRMLMERFDLDPTLNAEFNELSRSLNDLQDRAMRTRMVPLSTIMDKLQRAVRDLSRAQGKTIHWDARGIDTELDRGVLTQLSDSLLHLVRNAVDHGIEPDTVRIASGKPSTATIRLHAMQLGSEVIIAITDDGNGIDIQRIREVAARQGIDTDTMSDEDVLHLIFHSGMSTTSFVTDVSGRGVGLDVVRTNVEAAHGRVEVRSQPGLGTEFRVIVPITLAVLRCLLVESGGQRFALPFHRVVLSQSFDPSSQTSAEGRPVVWVEDQPVPVSTLAEALGLESTEAAGGPIVVLAGLAVVMVFFGLTAASPAATIASLLLMSIFGFATIPALQTRVMHFASTAPTLASGANIGAFNVGNALGAWLGGVTITAGLGYTSPIWAGAAMTALALIVVLVAARTVRTADGRRAAAPQLADSLAG